ncbi:MAG: manganese efflux pump, partial [Desulfobulbaceae bacterium]|nr:manganese efflux pump [Desulfobulbaceae bacterium]
MDAFAVSIATGVSLKDVSFRQTFRLSWHFGLFQAMMPVIGWSAGLSIRAYIEGYDHWVAFVLLAFVGINMIREAFQHDKGEEQKKDPTKGVTLVILSVATSIDA